MIFSLANTQLSPFYICSMYVIAINSKDGLFGNSSLNSSCRYSRIIQFFFWGVLLIFTSNLNFSDVLFIISPFNLIITAPLNDFIISYHSCCCYNNYICIYSLYIYIYLCIYKDVSVCVYTYIVYRCR